MALVIRMRQQGAHGRHCYRIVLTDTRTPRDGKYKEKLGWYDPNHTDDKECFLDAERLQYWIGVGAQVSENVEALARRKCPEVIKAMTERKLAKLAAKRAKRKKK